MRSNLPDQSIGDLAVASNHCCRRPAAAYRRALSIAIPAAPNAITISSSSSLNLSAPRSQQIEVAVHMITNPTGTPRKWRITGGAESRGAGVGGDVIQPKRPRFVGEQPEHTVPGRQVTMSWVGSPSAVGDEIHQAPVRTDDTVSSDVSGTSPPVQAAIHAISRCALLAGSLPDARPCTAGNRPPAHEERRVIGPDGRLVDFITDGLTVTNTRTSVTLPTGHGVLGCSPTNRAASLDDIAAHPRSSVSAGPPGDAAASSGTGADS